MGVINQVNNKRKKILWIVISILGVIILFLLPLSLDIFIFSNDYVSKVSNDGWAGFLGGYIGGIIGGIVTLIAMIVPLRQTKQQIIEAEEKVILEEKKKYANEIAVLVMQYIGDLQVYQDIKDSLEEPDNILFGEWRKYYELYQIWKECRKNRYFNGLKDYYQVLYEKNISEEYAKRFFRRYTLTLDDNDFDEYEKDLESKMSEIEYKRQEIQGKIDAARQKYVVGNNTYLLLELKVV